jgi:hypothetical protein
VDTINRRVLATGLLSSAMSLTFGGFSGGMPSLTATAATAPSPTPATPAPSPSLSGFPDATNTGPVAGTVFQNYTGNYEVRTDGAVIEGLRVTGSIDVHANNVTVQNCEVNASGQIWGIAQIENSGSGLKVFNCHVYGVPLDLAHYDACHVLDGVNGAVEVAFCNIHGVENGVDLCNYIHDNFIHDFANWVAKDNHTDGVQTYGWAGTGGMRIIHNTIISIETGGDFTPNNWQGGSSAIALIEGQHDLTIDNNLLAGGSYTMYGPSQHGAAPANVRVTNNRFSTKYYPRCGAYGTHDGFNRAAPGFVWSGNVWHETGRTVMP